MTWRENAEGLSKLFTLREAVASVSLSHDEDCQCMVCKAASGDKRALGEVYEWIHGPDSL